MSNDVSAQMIIDAIQRDEIDAKVKDCIEDADRFLLENGKKPDFYDEFIKITSRDLKTTINGCIKSRNNIKKKDDLKKYKEGYFNEIIQNANDIVWKVKDVKNPKMTVCVSKEKDNVYKVTCTYPDMGFSLENIYGFCTRGNSDKKSENGQEGMYGIGIKSLLCFVDELEINSNISIKVCKSSDGRILGDVDITGPNENREDFQTTLSFKFTYHADNKKNKHAGFNTGKLVKFIDEVYEGKNDGFKSCFFDGKDDEMVFDARSLFFTELRGDRTSENSIKCIEIKKSDNEQPILEIRSKEKPVCSDLKTKIKIAEIDGYYKYMIFHYYDEQISIAFEYNQKKQETELQDRLYATYFIGTYNNEKPLLGKRTGCLVNTTAINSSRSGLERENEKEPEILNNIMKKGNESIKNLCGLISEVSEKGAGEDKSLYLDILCQLIWIYRNSCEERNNGYELEYDPKYIFEDNVKTVEKSVDNWKFNNEYKFILKDEDGINDEKITINQPPSADDDNMKRLYEVYRIYFYPGKEKDIVLCYSDAYAQFTSGIRNLSSAFFDGAERWVSQIPNIPFLKSIKDVIERRIDGRHFIKIQDYLSKEVHKDDQIFIRQLIARYQVNNCFDFMGNYSDGTIKNWLFGYKSSDDPEYEKKAEEYKSVYGKLQDFIQNKSQKQIQKTRYYNDYQHEWWLENAPSYMPSVIQSNDLTCDDDIVIQLLSLIASSKIYIGRHGIENSSKVVSNTVWFAHDLEENIKSRSRWIERKTTGWSDSFQYFRMDNILIHDMVSFDKFKIARGLIDKYIDNISAYQFIDKVDIYFRDVCIKQCNIQKIELSEVTKIFEWLAVYKYIDNIKINIKEIEVEDYKPASSALIEFAKLFIGKDVIIKINRLSVSNNGKKFIGFVSNLEEKENKLCMYIRQSGKESYKLVGESENAAHTKFLLIYYSNNDEQTVLADVFEALSKGQGYDNPMDKDICDYFRNFIKRDNIRMLSASMYSKFLKRRKLEYEYLFQYEESVQNNKEEISILSKKDTYDFLTGEMSYDNHCPICNSIPTLDLEEKNINRLEERNFQVAILEATYKEKNIYVKIVCCKSCFKEYKDSLTEAIIEDVKGEDGKPEAAYKKMTLKNTISTLAMSRDLENEVFISPDNWKLICQFNSRLDSSFTGPI